MATEHLTPHELKAFTTAAAWELEALAGNFIAMARDRIASRDDDERDVLIYALGKRLESVASAVNLLAFPNELCEGSTQSIRSALQYADHCLCAKEASNG